MYTLTFEARDRGTPPLWSTQPLTIRLVPDIAMPPMDLGDVDIIDGSGIGGGGNGGPGRGGGSGTSANGALWNFGLDRHTFLVLLITAVTVVCVLLFAAAVLVLRHVDALRAGGSNGGGAASPPRGNGRKGPHHSSVQQNSFHRNNNDSNDRIPINFGAHGAQQQLLDNDVRRLTEKSPERKQQQQDLRVQVFQTQVGVSSQFSVQPSTASSAMLSPACWPLGPVCGPLQSQSSAGSSSGGCVGLPLPLGNEFSELKVISSQASGSAANPASQVVLRHHQSEDRELQQQKQLANPLVQQIVQHSRSSSLTGVRPIAYLKSETFLSGKSSKILIFF